LALFVLPVLQKSCAALKSQIDTLIKTQKAIELGRQSKIHTKGPNFAVAHFALTESCWGVSSPNPALFRKAKAIRLPPVFQISKNQTRNRMPKTYNTPKRTNIVKTRLDDEEHADFLRRLEIYDMNQSEFIREAIFGATIRRSLWHPSSMTSFCLPSESDSGVWQSWQQPQSNCQTPQRMAKSVSRDGKGITGCRR
jgi:hypothetical protein